MNKAQKQIFKDENKGFNIMYEYSRITHIIELVFKGSIYRINYVKYSDCLVIDEILFICYNIDKNKPDNYKNSVLRSYEVEYKQLYKLLTNYILGGL